MTRRLDCSGSRALAIDHDPEGVRVNAVCPGYIRTPLLERWFAAIENGEQEAAKAHPLRRIGDPIDVANAVLFLASGPARIPGMQNFENGNTLVRLAAMCRSYSSRLCSSTRPLNSIPTLFTMTETAPNFSSVLATAARTELFSLRPLDDQGMIRWSGMFSHVAGPLPHRYQKAPRSNPPQEIVSAIAAPMPEAAPVTRTVRRNPIVFFCCDPKERHRSCLAALNPPLWMFPWGGPLG
jgi:hypothetical protein